MIQIRPATQDERRFVRATWLESLQKDESRTAIAKKFSSGDEFATCWGRLIDHILRRASVTVACEEGAPGGLVVGWICFERDVLHYVYVRHALRHAGLARQLGCDAKFTPEGSWLCSHRTEISDRLLPKYRNARHQLRLAFPPNV